METGQRPLRGWGPAVCSTRAAAWAQKEQHQRQGQRSGQQLQAALQNTTEREGTSQLVAQQTSKGQQHRQQLEKAGPEPLQLSRQKAGANQLQKSHQPPVKGAPAFPQLEQDAQQQRPCGPGEWRGPVQGNTLQQQGR